jgi:hypothetical protein
MAFYSIRWDIELEADSPEDAAKEALEIQRDLDSFATSFEVFTLDGTGQCFVVDPTEKTFDVASEGEAVANGREEQPAELIADLKRELIAPLDDNKLWPRLTKLVLTQPPPPWAQMYFQSDYETFFRLIVAVGMLRNELIAWARET